MDIQRIKSEVVSAQKRIKNYIHETPLEYSPYLSALGESNVFLKLECLQVTGSPKTRGAFNKLLSMSEKDFKKGMVTASTGNLALAFAYALKILKETGTITLPETTAKTKIETLGNYPVTLLLHGKTWRDSDAFAQKIAVQKDLIYIYPLNDLEIIAGQGTVGIEILKKMQDIDCLFLCIGGGALVSGVAGYLKTIKPSIRIIGCWAQNASSLYDSIQAGKIVSGNEKPTLSDGSFIGGIQKDTLTFDIAKRLIDDYALVPEEDIRDAIKLVLEKHHILIEGTAGVALAGYLQKKAKYKGKNVVVLLCGRNIGINSLANILCDTYRK